MRQYVILILPLLLFGCGGGGSGGNDVKSITPAERLFGNGMGTGQTPTHLVPHEDGAGFEVLSFGAWGNVYDIKKTNNEWIFFGYGDQAYVHNKTETELYDFLEQKKLDIKENYRFLGDERVANAVFVGPAIMYAGDYTGANHSDYGTMKVRFGQDIGNNVVEFVMSDSNNNLTKTNVDGFFTEDRKNIAIGVVSDKGTYVGYGTKR